MRIVEQSAHGKKRLVPAARICVIAKSVYLTYNLNLTHIVL